MEKGKGGEDESRLFPNPYLYVELRFYVTSGENEENIKVEYRICWVSEFIASSIGFVIIQFIPEVSVERLALRALTPKAPSSNLVPRSKS
jgi:hypothetical protein